MYSNQMMPKPWVFLHSNNCHFYTLHHVHLYDILMPPPIQRTPYNHNQYIDTIHLSVCSQNSICNILTQTKNHSFSPTNYFYLHQFLTYSFIITPTFLLTLYIILLSIHHPLSTYTFLKPFVYANPYRRSRIR